MVRIAGIIQMALCNENQTALFQVFKLLILLFSDFKDCSI